LGITMKMRLLLIFLTVLAGCATVPAGPKFSAIENAPDAANVYVFRLYTAPYLRKPDLKVNDAVVGELPTNSYTVLRLKPGTYMIGTDWGILDGLILNKSATLSVEPGKSYYVHFTGSTRVIGTTVTYGPGVSTGDARDAAGDLAACSFVAVKGPN
jgi:hypothetical protein